jgi:hypothetical protein
MNQELSPSLPLESAKSGEQRSVVPPRHKLDLLDPPPDTVYIGMQSWHAVAKYWKARSPLR